VFKSRYRHSFLKRRWRPMQDNFERALRTIVVHDNGGQGAMSPGTPHESIYGFLMAIEPAPFAFERLQNERLEIAEVIVDDAIHLSRA